MDKIEIDVETLQEIQSELRSLRLTNMELQGQLMAVKRLLSAIQTHIPKESEVEYIPPVIAKINQAIEKQKKKNKDEDKQSRAEKLLDVIP